jgi:uncharacterized lipoprotein YehR (DUF1307 family)
MNRRVLKNVIIVELRISELKNIQKLYYSELKSMNRSIQKLYYRELKIIEPQSIQKLYYSELKINKPQYPETLLS